MKAILSVAGFDPTAAAGIVQDALILRRLGFRPLTLPTLLVAQDSHRIGVVAPVDPPFFQNALELLAADFDVAAVKLGLMSSELALVEVLSAQLAAWRATQKCPVVWDPVWRSSYGTPLMNETSLLKLKQLLLPHIDLITPNIDELSLLVHRPLHDIASAKAAAEQFYAEQGVAVLVTGLVMQGKSAQRCDLLIGNDDIHTFSHPQIEANPHGTGCLYSTLLTAYLAQGKAMSEAAQLAHLEMQKHLQQLELSAKSLRPFLPVGIV